MPHSAFDSASGEGSFRGSDTDDPQRDRAERGVRPHGQILKTRPGVLVLSVVGSAVAVASVGCFCALLYPILIELRGERVRAADGTEQRMLGFWSVSVLSLSVGWLCCVFWCTLTYINSSQPGMAFPTPLTQAKFGDSSGRGLYLDYGMAVLSGIMATLTVIWSLI